MLPRVRELEERFGDAVVAVGVHSGKYLEERRTPSIAEACLRLGVHHPVVNDRQFRVWRAYAVRAWPTLAVIDPDGYLIALQAGELPLEAMESFLGDLLSGPAGERVRREPFEPARPPEEPDTGPLRFPGKILASGRRLFVSDTGRHRVLELALEDDRARVVRRFGSGDAGFRDGSAEDAAFREPQGLALGADALFVADRANHAVRRVDLASDKVETVAGTGELGRRIVPGPARESPLRSPWDLALAGGRLFVAMPGSHQIWRIDLASARLDPHAGSGAEAIDDGPLSSATLAQPSGLVAEADRIWFVDAESSSVRWADVREGGRVGTVVGTGLFDFGDRDGTGDEVRLQHPLSLAWLGGSLVVADSYNGKLKIVDPLTRSCVTWEVTTPPAGGTLQLPQTAARSAPASRETADRGAAGSPETAGGDDEQGGEGRPADNVRPFSEPGGLAVDGGFVYVADTGNHRIVRVPIGGSTGEVLEIVEG